MMLLTARRLAVGTCVLTLVLIACLGVIGVLNGGDLYESSFTIVGVSSAIVGGVVASRRATNPVGWLFLGGALGTVVHVLAGEYAVYGIITSPGTLPLPYAMAVALEHDLVGRTRNKLHPNTFVLPRWQARIGAVGHRWVVLRR